VPFSPTSDARFHLFGGKLRTGNAGEYVVAGIIALLCASWVHLSPASFKNAPTLETSGFLPFFFMNGKKNMTAASLTARNGKKTD
jgi:inner membrane protein